MHLAPSTKGTFDVELIYEQQVMKMASYELSAESMEYGLLLESEPEPEPTPEPEPEPESVSPVASFTYSPLAPQVNDTIAFDASGCSDTDGTIVSYVWDFGDGETSSSQNPTHAYALEGSYSVTLTVTDDDGLTDTTTASIGEVVIPEFPSYALMLVALSVVAVASIIYKKKLKD